MFKVQAMINVKDFEHLTKLLEYFVRRNDLRFYTIIVETNDSGTFRLYRDLEHYFIEKEEFVEKCRIVTTGKFEEFDEVIRFLRIFERDIILEIEISVTIDDSEFEQIDKIINEIKQFDLTILQISKDVIIYEEIKN